ncbi:MAG: glycosyltransferase family 1 protein [Gammaproteobacteria bacterium]|nr:MAG: glycosyltransferase family 1 protein [Gammaproteobacteria bacterium]
MRIAICTDAWQPQINGVVTTLGHTRSQLETFGHDVEVFSPASGFRTVPLPGYPEIRLPVSPGGRLGRVLAAFAPECVHIATEGPIGWSARRWCLRQGQPFTTSYHTQFPEYLRARLPVPERFSYALLRRFHAPAVRTLVPTAQVRDTLAAHGFERLVLWTRGVDTTLFRHDRPPPPELDLPRPLWVYAGRVAVEKNLEAFLGLDLPGSKLVIGDGPARASLQKRYPAAHFAGYRFGEELSSWLAACDVFVFPSRTDTFGLVMLEAMACGLPVAAYPVNGPIDVVRPGISGVLDEDLGRACTGALALERNTVRTEACRHSWGTAARQFEAALVSGDGPEANAERSPGPADSALR